MPDTISARNNNMGFITFEPSGVLAANKTLPVTSPTINTSASGQLVIKPVIAPSHFT